MWDYMKAMTLFNNLTCFADVFFYLKWTNENDYSFQWFNIFCRCFLLSEKQMGGAFQKGAMAHCSTLDTPKDGAGIRVSWPLMKHSLPSSALFLSQACFLIIFH